MAIQRRSHALMAAHAKRTTLVIDAQKTLGLALVGVVTTRALHIGHRCLGSAFLLNLAGVENDVRLFAPLGLPAVGPSGDIDVAGIHPPNRLGIDVVACRNRKTPARDSAGIKLVGTRQFAPVGHTYWMGFAAGRCRHAHFQSLGSIVAGEAEIGAPTTSTGDR